ncbi:hypothetical protein ILUMI_23301 [Ignelater luminosus]|uniref:Metalloendopeptidase n=1 Tax=Ignelater luminosus TaxID=2038154 RepID=A0A8K0C8W2_IGNLU|nr:hypothetical protein ILUMI_23301 [Ignelater luminosus]
MFSFMVYFSATTVHLMHCLPSKDNIKADLSGNKVKQWNESSAVNPEELGTYPGGDVLFPNRVLRNGINFEKDRWPMGVIPFEFDGTLNKQDMEKVEEAMMEFHRVTCIRFRRRKPNDTDFISIGNNRPGCSSTDLGRSGGAQGINLETPACLSMRTILHELLHAIGFDHEHIRADRDLFVTIHWDNIQRGRKNIFMKQPERVLTSFGVTYDYNSLMHYSGKSLSSNGLPTMTAIKDPNIQLGPRLHAKFSKKDVEKIHLMYNCSEISTKNNSSDININ